MDKPEDFRDEFVSKTCYICGSGFTLDTMDIQYFKPVYGQDVCPSCLEGNFTRCEWCGEWATKEDPDMVINRKGEGVHRRCKTESILLEKRRKK